MFTKIKNFFIESRYELKQVQWPGRAEAAYLTGIVIGIALALAVFLGGLDYFFSYLLKTFVIKY
jgi:preprotein translocase subunit SecE